MKKDSTLYWAIILGGSEGIGLACAQKLALNGYNLLVVHRNRKSQMNTIEKSFDEIKKTGIKLISINISAVSDEGKKIILEYINEHVPSKSVKLFLHSIADGSVKNLLGENSLSSEDIYYTMNAMAGNYHWWSKTLLENNLFSKDARIIGLTSEGSSHVLPEYTAVGMAKAALEAANRYMAVEFAKHHITSNLISPGVTNTNALKVFSQTNTIIEKAKSRNPFGRLTTPEDIANIVYLMMQPEASWINGTIIRADGGEQLVF